METTVIKPVQRYQHTLSARGCTKRLFSELYLDNKIRQLYLEIRHRYLFDFVHFLSEPLRDYCLPVLRKSAFCLGLMGGPGRFIGGCWYANSYRWEGLWGVFSPRNSGSASSREKRVSTDWRISVKVDLICSMFAQKLCHYDPLCPHNYILLGADITIHKNICSINFFGRN